MTRALGISEAEWEALYRRLETPLYNLAYRYVWNSEEAQDIVHDAFIQLWALRHRLIFDTADRYAWITVLNRSKKHRRWRRAKIFLRGDDSLSTLPGTDALETEAIRSQEQALLHAAIERLPEKLRSVLLLAEFSELSYESIAELLAIPTGTVGSRRNLALQQLRSHLNWRLPWALSRARHKAHSRRKFVEAADLLEKPGRPHEALKFYKTIFRIERRIKHLSDQERLRERQDKTVPILTQFKAWLDHAVHTVMPKNTFGIAVNYALKHWEALTACTKAGHLEASNNFAERCMRIVAVGRKAFLFVGSERAGHAAAIYYSLVESCKANKVNPLRYLTYILTHARNKSITLPTPDEFAALSIAQSGRCAL